MSKLLIICVATGCGRVDFEYTADVTDAVGDASDAPPALCGLPFGAWTLSPPVALDEINSLLLAQFPTVGDRSEFDPVFSESGLELYFASDQSGRFVVWVATRPSLAAAFDTATILGADVNAGTNLHFGFQPLASLGRAIISAPFDGSLGGNDFWLGMDGAGGWSWQPTSLSTTGEDGDPRMTAWGLAVYFARGASMDARDIYRATRIDLDADFGAPELVSELNSPTSDAGPAPVASGAGIFIASNRPGGVGGEDIWYAARASTGVGYDLPYGLAPINSTTFDGEPAFLESGSTCELIFVSDRSGVFNLYRSVVSQI